MLGLTGAGEPAGFAGGGVEAGGVGAAIDGGACAGGGAGVIGFGAATAGGDVARAVCPGGGIGLTDKTVLGGGRSAADRHHVLC